jgi:hypothetical protein
MTPEQLLSELQLVGPESNAAASALAEQKYYSAVPDILKSIIRDCGWEIIPDLKIAAMIKLADSSSVSLMVRYLDRLDESDLEEDCGDVSDEFWRIQTAICRILVGIGSQVTEPVRAALALTNNRFTQSCITEVLIELGQAEEID